MENKLIVHKIAESFSHIESSEVKMIADTETGETELVISKTIIERYPITDYEKVMNLYERINRGGGRKLIKLKDL